jgi:outer membrane biogenesis lipoprotein LolB
MLKRIMKSITIIMAVVALAGCASRHAIEDALCRQWTQDHSDVACTTQFKRDGTVFVDYQTGTDLQGTWHKSDDNSIAIEIRDWKMTGRLDGKKLILKNGQNERTYSAK